MPIAYAGMLSMKKFAKCSAATITSASGRDARSDSPSRRSSACNASFSAGSARCARPVMPGAWLQTAAKTRLIFDRPPHTPATFSSVDVVIA